VDIEPELRVIDYVKEAAEFVRTADGLVSASAMLERFLFPPEQQYSPVGKLSGGREEKTLSASCADERTECIDT
jgi:ATP-binding cassette subfamily F protein uup